MPNMGIKMPILGMEMFMASVNTQSRLNESTNLASALFSGTRQKMLGLLFGQPDRAFSVVDLIQLADSGSGAVQREIKRLAESGLLTVCVVGRQKQYQANPDSPIFDELISLVRKTLGPAELIREALKAIADQLILAILYGSVAKGNDHAGSDIDLLLVSDKLTLETVYDVLASVENSLARPIQPTLYSTEEFNQRRDRESPFLYKILEGSHTVLLGKVDGTTTAGKPHPDWQAQS